MPKEKRKKSRAHVFVLHNYTDADEATLKKVAEKAVYMVYGKEICPETGGHHLQGYVYYENRRVSSSVSKKLGGCWTECARGTPQHNTKYCSKDGKVTTYGEEPAQGKRTDLTGFIDAVRDSEERLDVYQLIEEHPQICARHQRFVDKVQNLYHPLKDLTEFNNFWYYGVPGGGKSYAARQLGPYYAKAPVKWFDGYCHEDIIIIEELSPGVSSEMTTMMKLLSDLYPYNCEIKGTMTMIRPKTIVVTSNYSIDQMGWDEITTIAVKRRFEEVEFPDVYVADS